PRAIGTICAALVVISILAYQRIPAFDWHDPAGANFGLYFALALALPTLFQIGNHLPGERLAGDLSYPIYICHLPVQAVIQSLLLQERMSLFIWFPAIVLIVAVAPPLLLVAPAPIEKFRVRFKSMSSRAAPSAQLA